MEKTGSDGMKGLRKIVGVIIMNRIRNRYLRDEEIEGVCWTEWPKVL